MPIISKMRSGLTVYPIAKWIEYALSLGLAILLTIAVYKEGTSLSAVILIASMGLILMLLCIAHIEIGFYALLASGFLLAAVDRMFRGQYPLTSMLMTLPYFFTCLIFMKEMQQKKFSGFPRHPVILFYLLLVIYMVVEIFNPNMHSFLGWFSAFWQRISYVLFLFVSCYIFNSIKRIRFFFKFIAVALFVTALYGCIQQWFGLSSFDYRWVHSDPHIYGLFSLPGQGLRKFSILTDPANFGTLMAGGGALILILLQGRFSKKNKGLFILFAVVILLGMSYSGTRTASIILMAGIALYILMTIYQKRTQILALAAALAFLFILFVPIYGNPTLNRFRSAFEGTTSDASLDVRLIHQEMMQPYMQSHPFGGGINTVGTPGAKYNPHHVLAGFPPDSAYFAIALQEGWVGLGLQCIFLFLVLFYCIHYFYKCRNWEVKTYYAAMAAMLFALFVGAYAQFTISSIPQSLIFIPFLAIIAQLHTFDTDEKNNKINL